MQKLIKREFLFRYEVIIRGYILMANLDSLDQKPIEKDYTIVQPTEELDKLNDSSVPEDDTSPILLALLAVIPMAILIILFII
jgi:hypothetical protein